PNVSVPMPARFWSCNPTPRRRKPEWGGRRDGPFSRAWSGPRNGCERTKGSSRAPSSIADRLRSGPASIDDEVVARHVTGERRGQKEEGAGEVFLSSHSS